MQIDKSSSEQVSSNKYQYQSVRHATNICDSASASAKCQGNNLRIIYRLILK